MRQARRCGIREKLSNSKTTHSEPIGEPEPTTSPYLCEENEDEDVIPVQYRLTDARLLVNVLILLAHTDLGGLTACLLSTPRLWITSFAGRADM